MLLLTLLLSCAPPPCDDGYGRTAEGECELLFIPDGDRDGYHLLEDCDDEDPTRSPGLEEIPCDGIDQDCDGLDDDAPDEDGDGWDACSQDCDDLDPAVHPEAEEVSNKVDDDCDGRVLVGEGSAYMGEDTLQEYAPQHLVETSAFILGTHEVTNAEYVDFLTAEGNTSPENLERYDIDDAEGDGRLVYDGTWSVDETWADHPVVEMSWFGARDYCTWLGGRLPSEAEWEKAARGGCETHGDPGCDPAEDTPPWPWGEDSQGGLPANTSGTLGTTSPVGSYPDGASPYGALDLVGNTWEWVDDCWHDSYEGAPTSGRAWREDCEDTTGLPEDPSFALRVRRGGSYSTSIEVATVSVRFASNLGDSNQDAGFRCAWDVAR